MSGGLDDVDKLKVNPGPDGHLDRGAYRPPGQRNRNGLHGTETGRLALRIRRAITYTSPSTRSPAKTGYTEPVFRATTDYDTCSRCERRTGTTHFLPADIAASKYEALKKYQPGRVCRMYGEGEWGSLDDMATPPFPGRIHRRPVYQRRAFCRTVAKRDTSRPTWPLPVRICSWSWRGMRLDGARRPDVFPRTEGDEVVRKIQSDSKLSTACLGSACAFDAGGVGIGLRGFLRSSRAVRRGRFAPGRCADDKTDAANAGSCPARRSATYAHRRTTTPRKRSTIVRPHLMPKSVHLQKHAGAGIAGNTPHGHAGRG
jgi:hypothetical protein